MRRFHFMFVVAVVVGIGCVSNAPKPTAVQRGALGQDPPVPTTQPLPEVSAVGFEAASATSQDVPTASVQVVDTRPDRERLITWMLGFMTRKAPPGRKTWYVEAQETEEDAMVRYHGIANAIVDVVFDPTNKPLFKGAHGRSRTVSVILALALFESGFMRNVDFGIGDFGIGDSGNSYCLLQMNVGKGHTISWNTKEDRPFRPSDDQADFFLGYTGPELVGDRKKCVGESLKALRLSFNSCSGLPLDQSLRIYGAGNCGTDAEEASRVRMQTAIRFWDESAEERKGWSDQVVMDMVEATKGSAPAAAPVPVAEPKVESKDLASLP